MSKVFISYSRADGTHAAALEAWLTAQGVATFFDRRDLGSGQLWLPDLEKAIEQEAEAIVVLCGPGGLGNTQQYEAQLAITRQAREPGFPIIPVVLPGTEDYRLPRGFLALQTWVSFKDVKQSVTDERGALQRLLAAVRREPLDADAVRGAICPYKGLEAFEEADAQLFFGRDAEAEALLRTVQEHRVAAVIGRSGTGKSSLARAGLLPRLRRRGQDGWGTIWDSRVIRPGRSPLQALAATLDPAPPGLGKIETKQRLVGLEQRLRDVGPDFLTQLLADDLANTTLKTNRVLLLVDQAEELFTRPIELRGADEFKQFDADAAQFIALLLAAAERGPASVVLTIRSDFFAPLQDSPFGPVLKNAMVQVGRVQELRPCIEGPAGIVGLRFSPGLVDRVLGDVGSDESNLPLLQHALERTWRLRDGAQLTADAYVKAGGVSDAINKAAEDSYQALTAAEKEAARRLFLRLVRPGEGGANLRQRSVLPQDAAERAVAYRFADPQKRLLFIGEEHGQAVVEVAHEALIRGWPTLVEWVSAARERLQARADVLAWREQFSRQGKDAELIPEGALLARARELVTTPGDVPVDDIKGYVQRSVEAVERVAREQLRRARRRTAVFAVLALLSLGAAVGAGWFWQQAQAQREQAERNFDAAEATARTLIDGLRRGRDAEGVPLVSVAGILTVHGGGKVGHWSGGVMRLRAE